MSVVEFSADSWQASSPGLQEGLGDWVEALTDLAQGLESLAGSGNISGAGADAMRAYIREVHVPIVQSLLVCLYTFQTAIGVYWSGYGEVDADGNFRLVNDEFDDHVTQLDTGVELLRGFATDLRGIAARASHLVSLGSAGADAVEGTISEFENMQVVAKTQHETWQAYEATDHGFNQVKNLLGELKSILNNVGSLTVGQGRSYTAGSFTLALQTLSGLTGGMLDYCRENQQVASDGWDVLFSGYVDDVEAEQERQRKEDALWGVLWDGIQVVEGVLILAVGVVGTPFSAGATLALAALGGSLIVGGVNSAIDHASIAATGEGLNLVGMVSDQVAHWYDVTVMRPAVESGSWAGQLVAGVGSGVGQMISGAAQMNLRDTGRGIEALLFDEDVRNQALQQVTTLVDQVRAGNPVVIGQIVGNILPGAVALKVAKTSGLLGRADKFADFAKPVITNPSRTTSALDWLKNHLGAGGVTVSDVFEPTIRSADGLQSVVEKIRRGELTSEEIKSLPNLIRDQLRGIDRGDKRDIFGHYTGSDAISANKEALGLEKVRDRLGVEILSDQVGVRLEAGGQLRYYDGLIDLGGNRYVGIEVKSGSATPEYQRGGNGQRLFDSRVSSENPARGLLNGEPIEIVEVILQEIP
ncbi:T7SS effector LXG polymorphic toxin [Rathayibacter rathayi]|uniref:T7SS effector LXG polymorphic toxin n=8 Tax=Rathayibacter rathayi TaxID=33887 RepID=UPI000FD96E8D|nr:T7SS effector LXG polymorphic toxin [Rathayibacter rathayi]AZZ48161.1 hypothetical protein C1O28_02220 [Rathayibacter rathayi]TWD70856.1 WXG superfamily protein probably secreted by type VII secretion system [Rathayibacter rathayi]